MDWRNYSFCEGRYSILDSFCFVELFYSYTLNYKPKEVDKNENYQPYALACSLVEGNENCCSYPIIITLMNSNDKMHCRKKT